MNAPVTAHTHCTHVCVWPIGLYLASGEMWSAYITVHILFYHALFYYLNIHLNRLHFHSVINPLCL